MDSTSGRSETLWFEGEELPRFEALERDLACDVVVIGAGIAGLSTAYNALKKGLSVIVLEDGQVCSGESGRTSAHLTNSLDKRFYRIEKYHGADGSRLAAESHSSAINWIEEVCRAERIDCDFERVDGYLFAPSGGDIASLELEKEYQAARRAGLDVSWADKNPWPSYEGGKCLMFHRQAQFHPLRYLAALSRAIVKSGGQIFTHTHAVSATGGEKAFVETKSGHRVNAKHVVVTTNVPFNARLSVHTKQASYRSYVIAALIPSGALPHALYWDTGDPYHYVRVAPVKSSKAEEMLIVGGEDHKTGQPDPAAAPHDALEAWARARFPQMKDVVYRWSGQIVEPNDGLAHIGRASLDKSNVYVATGDAGNGLTHGTIAGLLLTDLILGNLNPWAALYDPDRVTVRSGGEFLKENVNSARQYLDWLTPGEAMTVDGIEPGCGAVLRSGLKKIAVYRHAGGGICAMSAVCPHLGAIVGWNAEEKTWDCPAHGSRFSPMGQPLNGPANSSLAPVNKATADLPA